MSFCIVFLWGQCDLLHRPCLLKGREKGGVRSEIWKGGNGERARGLFCSPVDWWDFHDAIFLNMAQ